MVLPNIQLIENKKDKDGSHRSGQVMGLNTSMFVEVLGIAFQSVILPNK